MSPTTGLFGGSNAKSKKPDSRPQKRKSELNEPVRAGVLMFLTLLLSLSMIVTFVAGIVSLVFFPKLSLPLFSAFGLSMKGLFTLTGKIIN